MSEEPRKIALVTGASRGIGAAIASALADAGLVVVGTATSEQGAGKINEALSSRGGHGRVLNVTDVASIDALLAGLRTDLGDPLVLVNNAGITQDNIIMRMKDDEWQSVIDTNLTALYRLSKACVRGMTKARWGRVINLTSVVGSMGNAGQSNYAAAKAGIVGYSKSLAQELGSRGVTVNCVAPGLIGTDMTETLSEKQREQLLERIPAGRLGEVAEVAELVAFLVGDLAGYITGETIHINGGMYMN